MSKTCFPLSTYAIATRFLSLDHFAARHHNGQSESAFTQKRCLQIAAAVPIVTQLLTFMSTISAGQWLATNLSTAWNRVETRSPDHTQLPQCLLAAETGRKYIGGQGTMLGAFALVAGQLAFVMTTRQRFVADFIAAEHFTRGAAARYSSGGPMRVTSLFDLPVARSAFTGMANDFTSVSSAVEHFATRFLARPVIHHTAALFAATRLTTSAICVDQDLTTRTWTWVAYLCTRVPAIRIVVASVLQTGVATTMR